MSSSITGPIPSRALSPQPEANISQMHVAVRIAQAAVPYLILLVSSYYVFAETTDDPFVTFRYAANILAGKGPTFNPGEHVEGFSSPLHLLLCIALIKLAPSLGILFKAKVVSLLFAAVAVWQAGNLSKKLGYTRLESVAVQVLICLNINFALSATNALESTLFASLLLWSITKFIAETSGTSGYASSFLLLLALLARPETIAVFVLLLIVRCLGRWKLRSSDPSLIAWFGIFVIGAGLLLILRISYYGRLLPNTYYAKNAPAFWSIKSGVESLLQCLSPLRLEFRNLRHGHSTATQWLQLIIAPIFWGTALLGGLKFPNRVAKLAIAAAITAACCGILRSGGDWMFGSRFIAPVLPLLAIFQYQGIRCLSIVVARGQGIGAHATSWLSIEYVAKFAVLALWTVGWLAAPKNPWAAANFGTQDEELLVASKIGLGPLWIALAHRFQKTLPSGALVAYSEMGYGPYNNLDKEFLDLRGLTDGRVSRMPSSFKSFTGVTDPSWYNYGDPISNLLNEKRPDMIVDVLGSPSRKTVLGDYELVEIVRAGEQSPTGAREAYVYVQRRAVRRMTEQGIVARQSLGRD